MRERRTSGFTLIEALFAAGLASVIVIAALRYLGFTLQGFSQQESTLTGSRDAQILLSYLRDDLTAADGNDSSSTATTGTTFPKSELHLVQALGSDTLLPYIHTRVLEPLVPPGADPVTSPMPEPLRTAAWLVVLGIPADDPLADYLPPGQATNALLRELNYAMNAAAWTHPAEPEKPHFFNVNVRSGPDTFPVSYYYLPKERRVRRYSRLGVSILGFNEVEHFSVSPCFEFLVDPAHKPSTAELVRVFYEISFSLKAPEGGQKIARRLLSFSTRVTPKYLNSVIKSRWGL